MKYYIYRGGIRKSAAEQICFLPTQRSVYKGLV